jgi:hypothetical protein
MLFSIFPICGCDDEKTEMDSSQPSSQHSESKSVETESEAKGSVQKAPPEIQIGATDLKDAYQIRNVKHGLFLRPKGARSSEGNPIVLYPQYPWECLSWRLKKGPNGTYRLINIHTNKTIQPAEAKSDNTIPVLQVTPGDQSAEKQCWRFVRLTDGFYKILSANADLALTAVNVSGETFIHLAPYKDDAEQKWELVDMPEKLTM